MSAVPTKPVAKRSTELSDRRDIVRRLLFLSAIVDAGLGVGFVISGLRKAQAVIVIVGLFLLASASALWLLRKKWGAAQTVEEIRANPFRPDRAPKE